MRKRIWNFDEKIVCSLCGGGGKRTIEYPDALGLRSRAIMRETITSVDPDELHLVQSKKDVGVNRYIHENCEAIPR